MAIGDTDTSVEQDYASQEGGSISEPMPTTSTASATSATPAPSPANRSSVVMTRPMQPQQSAGPQLPQPTLDRAYKMMDFFQQNPQWLANPYTTHAANAILANSSKIVGMSIQLDSVNAKADAARLRLNTDNRLINHLNDGMAKLRDMTMVAAIREEVQANGPSPRAISMLNEQLRVETSAEEQRKQDLKTKAEAANAKSSAGKELADRMDLEKKFGADSPQVKKFDELASKASSLSNLGTLLKERKDASPEDRAQYDRVIGHIGEKMGVSMQQDDQGRWIVNYGPQQGTVGTASVATQSMAQRKLLKYEAASELINHLQKNMESGHVGVSGVLGEYVGDKILPQLGVDSFVGKRADIRSTMIAARESLLREISDDTRFSNADREEISKALPSSGVFESLPNAQQRLATVRNILNARGRTYSEGLGISKPEWSLTAEEIKSLYEKNQATNGKEGLSFDKAKTLLERFH